MESVKDLYETMLRVFEKVNILYEAYEKQATQNDELKTLFPYTTLFRSQRDHDALKEFLQKEKEEMQQM